MKIPSMIAIDGPAASGKSTLGKRLADTLGYLFFDTGLMYRAITWLVINSKINVTDERSVVDIAESSNIDVRPPSVADGRNSDILVNFEDITWAIRDPKVDSNVSLVSTYPGVRRALTNKQRAIGLRGNVVMVGRDIGTVVLPEADLKIYLDASSLERAKRRHNEVISRGNTASMTDVLIAMEQRDQKDSNREVAPLKPAEDAFIVISDQMNADEVFEIVLKLVHSIADKLLN